MSNSSTKPFGAPDGESVRSPYAPKKSRGGATGAPAHPNDDDPPPPRFLVSSRNEQEEDVTNFTESSLKFGDAPMHDGFSRRASAGERRSHSYAAAERSRNDAADDNIDLLRLEESVRRLQREAAVNRAHTPVDEPPRAPVHPQETRVQRRRADTYIDGYRVPPSLQPEVLTPPAELNDGHGRLWTLMSMLIASAVAAPIAYYFAAGGSTSSSDTRLASADTRPAVETLTVTAPAIPARPQRVQPPSVERRDTAPESEAPPVTVVPRRFPSSTQAPEAAPPAAPPTQNIARSAPPPQNVERARPPVQSVERVQPPVQNVERAPPAPMTPSRTIDPGEIDILLKQGQQFVAAGDFVTARLVFQRAAEAGNAAAALALGATFDPVVLSRLGVRGVDADVGKARVWYQKAKEFGAPDADRRLSTLANR